MNEQLHSSVSSRPIDFESVRKVNEMFLVRSHESSRTSTRIVSNNWFVTQTDSLAETLWWSLIDLTADAPKIQGIPVIQDFPTSPAASSAAQTSARAISLLGNVRTLRSVATERTASRHLIGVIESAFVSRDLGLLNEILLNLVDADVGEMPTAAAIRTTFRSKTSLPAWQTALDSARTYFRQRRYDWEDLLGDL